MTATWNGASTPCANRSMPRLPAFFSSCVSCGLCAEACIFYRETEDPKYTPINKVEPMRKAVETRIHAVWPAGKISGAGAATITDQKMLTEWETLVYDSCTMCGRCTHGLSGGQ